MNMARQHCKGLGLALTLLLLLPTDLIQAADGDVIISRTVQPRIATRPTMVPDPHPRAVNASPTHYIGNQLGTNQLSTGELSDHEFSQISSGRLLPAQLPGVQPGILGNNDASNRNSASGLNAVTHNGGAGSQLGGQINRSVQQGLQPLQMLGGQ